MWQSYVRFFAHTPAPSSAALGGGLAHSYASADKTYYVKLLCKSFNINDLQAARAAAEPCKPRKPQHIVCRNH